MHNFSYKNKWERFLTPAIVSILTRIHEFKIEQMIFVRTKADVLSGLIENTKKQSIEASNKIDNICSPENRLKNIVFNKTTPRTPSEQKIAGYRDVFTTIHESYGFIPVKPPMILQLHKDLYKYSGHATGGNYKNVDSMIAQESAKGNQAVKPVSAQETPQAMDNLCAAFEEEINQNGADPLLIIPMFILDFLCIRPFQEGNGIMSRLLALLLLSRSGYTIGKYVSIEKLLEESQENYYAALRTSAKGWHENQNDYIPFVQYMLELIATAYRDFFEEMKALPTEKQPKTEQVREIIRNSPDKIIKTEIMKKCPNISQITVQRALSELLKNGEIIKLSGGRYSAYVWNSDKK